MDKRYCTGRVRNNKVVVGICRINEELSKAFTGIENGNDGFVAFFIETGYVCIPMFEYAAATCMLGYAEYSFALCELRLEYMFTGETEECFKLHKYLTFFLIGKNFLQSRCLFTCFIRLYYELLQMQQISIR